MKRMVRIAQLRIYCYVAPKIYKRKEPETSMRKNLHKNLPKLNISLCIAAVMFCLTLFSTYFVSGLYASYTSSGQNTNDARVAIFSVKGGGALTKPIDAKLVPGEVSETSLIITNSSEVAVDCTIEVTNVTKNLPLKFCVTKEGSTPDESAWKDNGCTLAMQQLPAGGGTAYTLHIKWVNQDAQQDLDLMGQVDYITVTVTATQVD